MADKVAIVTGASRGIGRTVAEAFIERGYRVALVARTKAALEELAQGSDHVLALPVDVADAAAIDQAVQAVVDKWGAIDILFNNAGILREGTSDASLEDFDDLYRINLRAAFVFIKAVAPHMKSQRSGYVFNLASRSGKFAFPKFGAYAASKFGMIGLNEALFKELAPYGVKVTALCPSWVDTDMAQQGDSPLDKPDMIQTADIMKTVDWLLELSPAAAVQEVIIYCGKLV
ncbi:MAG: SDR family oxidoreductase [Gammaproteobacteria bacterium]|nr:SDR family oxidoreductase [Gammaproteobacteria bacterium]